MKQSERCDVGAGAARRRRRQGAVDRGIERCSARARQVVHRHDCRKDDLRNQRTTMLGNAFGPEDEGNPACWVDASGVPRIVAGQRKRLFQNDAACVGGGTLSWGAQAWRYMPQDFKMRSTYGAPAGSSLEDWPISYDDLEPFYEKAEYEIGVSGDYSGTPFHGPRRRRLPMPPLPESGVWNSGAGGQAPRAASVSYSHGAQQCALQRPRPLHALPVVRWICLRNRCEERLQNTVIPVALNTGNCELRTECQVKEVLTDERGARAALPTSTANGHLQEQLADIVVVSGGATESARLLLNSKSRLFPNGLGNRYDQVGRNLQGHHYTGAMGISTTIPTTTSDPAPALPSATTTTALPAVRRRGCWPMSSSACRFTPLDRLPPNTPRWGLGHKQAMREWHKRTIVIMGRPSRFLRPTPGSLLIHRCATSGECRCAHLGQCASPHL
jgi:choline dehydrogenase-like flavoprotein